MTEKLNAEKEQKYRLLFTRSLSFLFLFIYFAFFISILLGISSKKQELLNLIKENEHLFLFLSGVIWYFSTCIIKLEEEIWEGKRVWLIKSVLIPIAFIVSLWSIIEIIYNDLSRNFWSFKIWPFFVGMVIWLIWVLIQLSIIYHIEKKCRENTEKIEIIIKVIKRENI